MVADPLAVVDGWKEPQSAASQVTVQFTCGSEDTSFTTVAVSGRAAPTWIDAGGVGANDTAMGRGATMVMVAEAERLGFATDVAVTFTVFPDGMLEGAV